MSQFNPNLPAPINNGQKIETNSSPAEFTFFTRICIALFGGAALIGGAFYFFGPWL